MNAVFLGNSRNLRDELSLLQEADGNLFSVDTDIFSEDVATPFSSLKSAGNENLFSLYSIPDSERYNKILIGSDLNLLEGAWAAALLGRCRSALAAGGSIFVPVFGNDHGDAQGRFQTSWIENLLGSIAATSTYRIRLHPISALKRRVGLIGMRYARIDSPKVCERRFSILSAFVENRERFVGASAKAMGSELGHSEEHDRRAMMNHSYYVGGVRYKAAIVGGIVRELVSKKDQGLAMLDVGGGYGLLSCELLGDEGLGIEEATNCDCSSTNLRLYEELMSCVPELEGKVKFDLSTAESFPFPGRFDLVTFVGSLLYVPREQTGKVLDRAFASLKSGGVLVVHENIKNESYKTDYDKMFTPGEIDGLMARYGEIHYYSSRRLKKLRGSCVGRRTVFRVVQKR